MTCSVLSRPFSLQGVRAGLTCIVIIMIMIIIIILEYIIVNLTHCLTSPLHIYSRMTDRSVQTVACPLIHHFALVCPLF
jgi:type IV secretory pathway VirB3-like protein